MLKKLDAFRKPERVRKFALACQADSQGRGGDFPDMPYPQTERIQEYFIAANAVNAGGIARAQTDPKNIAAAIDHARCEVIAILRREGRNG